MSRPIIRSAGGPWGSIQIQVACNLKLQRWELFAVINGVPFAGVPYADTQEEAVQMANEWVDAKMEELAMLYERRHITTEDLRQAATNKGLELSEKVLFFHSYFVVKWVNAMPLSWANRMTIALAELETVSGAKPAEVVQFKPPITDFGKLDAVPKDEAPSPEFRSLH